MCTIGFFYREGRGLRGGRGVGMACGTYRFDNDEFLEVHEGEAGVADEVGAFTAVEIGLKSGKV